MATPQQINANQQNAQHSPGPVTAEGKQKSSQNARKHGFTGLSLVVTPEEMEAYQSHVQSYLDHHQPAGHMHAQLVRQLADLHWSLHQIFVQQSNTMSLMSAITAQMNAAGDPIATAAALAPVARTLNTLNLYEVRRRRAAKTIQEELAALEQAASEQVALAKSNKTTEKSKIGFDCSSDQSSPAQPTLQEQVDRALMDADALIRQLEAADRAKSVK
jgi:hypothetical protein